MEKSKSRSGTPAELELLAEIEAQNPENVAGQRLHERVSMRTRVILRPGNASQVRELKIQGMTGDLSEGGCRALFPIPVMVGDIFRLEFDLEWLDAPTVYARCLRCRMVREDVFETGFQFFNSIDLSAQSKKQKSRGGDLLD